MWHGVLETGVGWGEGYVEMRVVYWVGFGILVAAFKELVSFYQIGTRERELLKRKRRKKFKQKTLKDLVMVGLTHCLRVGVPLKLQWSRTHYYYLFMW